MFVCKLKRKPLVATWHEVWGRKYWVEYLGAMGIFGHIIEVVTSRLPDKIISVSRPTQNDLERVLGRKSDVVHNGISIDDLMKIKARKDKNKIIAVGRLIPEKRFDEIIKAMPAVLQKNKNAHLVIIGEGPERKKLQNLAKPLGKHVVFKDFVPRYEDLIKEIKSSAVFVTQSSREGFGITIIEALACGTSVVIPRYLAGFPYAAHCTIADGDGLAGAILNPKKANPESVKSFDWDIVAKEMEGVYVSVVV